MKRKILLFILTLILFPNFVLAKSNYVEFSDNLILEENKSNSYAAFGDKISVKNEVDGVYAIFGNSIEYNANNQYVLMFSNNIDITGSIKDGIIFGNDIEFKNSLISRDIVIFGNEVKLSGTFNGNVVVFASSIEIENSSFSKDLITYSSELDIDNTTIITGKLQYDKDTRIDINSNNIGNIVIKENSIENEKISDKIVTYIYNLIKILVIFLAMYLIIPKLFDRFSNDIGKNFLYGAISFITLPIVLLILLFTTFASSVALIGIFIYVIFIMISKVITGYIVGEYIFDKFIKIKKEKYLCGLLGITLVYLLSLIPIIGGLITLASIVYSFGIIINMFIKERK